MVAQIIKPPPFDQLAQTPEPVVALIRRMLEKRPEDRFQTPEELQEATEQAAKQLSEQFNAVPERIAPLPTPSQDGLSSGKEPSEPVALRTVDLPLLDAYLAVETGRLFNNRYQLVAEEREGNGGRLFQARDEKAPPTQNSVVAIKLLHPGIAADSTLLDLIENELGVINKAVRPHLVRYHRLERDASGPYLVREWIHGFLLYDLLRWRRSLKATELVSLLEPLAITLDFVAGQGLGLVDLNVRKLLFACPDHVRDFEALAKTDAREWTQCTLKLNPLSLAPLLFKSRNGWDLQTIVPASRVLSLTQAEAGIRGTKAVRLYGKLIYELLSGRPQTRNGDPDKYAPLPELDQTGNDILRHVCGIGDTTYRSCQEFWSALKENLAAPQPRQASTAPPPASPSPEPVLPAPPEPPPKRPQRWTLPVTILGGAAIIGLAIFAAIRSGNAPSPAPSPTSSPSPVAEVTATPTPPPVATSATPATEPGATPTPVSTEQLEKTFLEKAQEKILKGDYQAAVSDYTEAIHVKPDDPQAHYNRGNAYLKLAYYDVAITDYTEAIRLKPDYPEAYCKRGNAYYDKGGYGLFLHDKEAISDYTEAIRLKPGYAEAYSGRGKVYEYLKQYDKAISDYSEAIRLEPDIADYYYNRSNAYALLGKMSQAKLDRRKAKELEQ